MTYGVICSGTGELLGNKTYESLADAASACIVYTQSNRFIPRTVDLVQRNLASGLVHVDELSPEAKEIYLRTFHIGRWYVFAESNMYRLSRFDGYIDFRRFQEFRTKPNARHPVYVGASNQHMLPASVFWAVHYGYIEHELAPHDRNILGKEMRVPRVGGLNKYEELVESYATRA